MNRHFLYVFALATLLLVSPALSETSQAAETLRIHNNMKEAVRFWIKSEHKKSWTNILIRRGKTRRISLTSPDRFLMVVRDRQGIDYHCNLLPLRKRILQEPEWILELDSIFETKMKMLRRWNYRTGRWETIIISERVRAVVTFDFRDRHNRQVFEEIMARPRK